MSRKGNCYDNAPMESFWGTLKNESLSHYRFNNRDEAISVIREYIEIFYNRQRRHSRLGNISPAAFREKYHQMAVLKKRTNGSVRYCQYTSVLIKDILFYLNNNYREKITLEQLSKKFRASVSYICHEFTKEYRISPINYVIQRRMTEAKWSLTNTELSQAEISWRVGYENVDHFAKLFLRHVGCSPSDYRRQFKNCFAEQEILSEFPQPVSLAG
ncbi:transcriptional regulator, AraC family [Shigella dysenteriae 1617]|nr:transcriptional regulator, AraC family [Shigella dysenteriae 1617]